MCNQNESGFRAHFEKHRRRRIQISFVHHYNTLLDESNLVCTNDDLSKVKDILIKTDVIKLCSRERMNTKWRFYKLNNLTVFAALLKGVPMGCNDAVLPEPLLKNCTLNHFTCRENKRQPYNTNLGLFCALSFRLYGNQRLEKETAKIFKSFMKRMEGLSHNQFKGST